MHNVMKFPTGFAGVEVTISKDCERTKYTNEVTHRLDNVGISLKVRYIFNKLHIYYISQCGIS